MPGQVKDDASIRTAAGTINTNFALLRAVRQANSDTFVICKPHPDVAAWLRLRHMQTGDCDGLADRVVASVNPINLLSQIHGELTMTSLLWFEVLLRGNTVVT